MVEINKKSTELEAVIVMFKMIIDLFIAKKINKQEMERHLLNITNIIEKTKNG